MIFSIKAAIRALIARHHRINCRSRRWQYIVDELQRRGKNRHEAGAFLLGFEHRGRLQVSETVFYDELDSNAYATGVCVLTGDAFAKLWSICRTRGLTVVADVHTHPGAAFQSPIDRTNPMVARPGHIAIIVPNYGTWPIRPDDLGLFEYRGNHQWVDRTHPRTRQFFYTGFWS